MAASMRFASRIIVSTNTSGIPINAIAEVCSEGFKQHFLGMHFFNPPRYLKLLEIIPTKDTCQGSGRVHQSLW
jgi:3-hydroxyacyl-CoA dehydrogenase